jgi:Ca-activated chloride channel family protein
MAACAQKGAYSNVDYGNDYEMDESIPSDGDANEPQTNPWVMTADDAVSTFSADVDTGSYSLTRRALVEGTAVTSDSIRVEEFMNYFHYDTAPPAADSTIPFDDTLELSDSPFGHDDTVDLLRIAIQAETIPLNERAPVNLVFLLDVSGSMDMPDKLGLVQFAMKQLVDRLAPDDTLSIVTYAGYDAIALQPTAVENKSVILDALDALSAGGGTNGEAGILAAYQLAEEAFRDDGVNRVILCSDGDMNIGVTGGALVRLVEQNRDRGIFLTTLGFGTDNYNDEQMEQLADNGNGNYAYIDSKNEALRVLGENLVSTLQVVAKDVKLQVEFDPTVVEQWRLIGYENRLLLDEQFDDDAVDAGDIGAGHHVTALYEVILTDASEGGVANIDIRYKEPTEDESTLHTWSIDRTAHVQLGDATHDFRFTAGVAEFAEVLRDSPHSEGERYADIRELVDDATAGRRDLVESELLQLIDAASER